MPISIYIIRNTHNGKLYIGQSHHPDERWKHHQQPSVWRHEPTKHLYRAMKKYGSSAFTFDVIEEWETQEDANEAESFWIEFFGSMKRDVGYNLREGGSNGRPSADARYKMSVGRRGKGLGPWTEARKRARSIAFKGRVISDETKKRMSVAQKSNKKNSGKWRVDLAQEIKDAVRSEYEPGTKGRGQKSIAKKYGLSQQMVVRIVKGER